MKRMKWMLVWAACLMTLSGCQSNTKTYTENYPKMYKDFLTSSLGDWKVVKTEKKKYVSDTKSEPNREYIIWDIAFTDQNGKIQLLHLRNDESIEKNVLAYIEKKMKAVFKKEVGETRLLSVSDAYFYDGLSDSEEYYKEHPKKFYEKYKDVLQLKNFSLPRFFANSPIYVHAGFDLTNKELTLDEKVKKWDETRTKMLKLIPSINMDAQLDITSDETVNLQYVNGTKVESTNYEIDLMDKYKQFDMPE